MNTVSLIFWVIEIVILIIDIRADCFDDSDVVEKFYWTPKNELPNIEWEFIIIGKRVSWNVGKILCSSGNLPKRSLNGISIDDTLLPEILTTTKSSSKHIGNSGLAVLNEANMTLWLARKLSESNYQYDGLWIGGHRKTAGNNWTWIESEGRDEIPVASSSIVSNNPKWYRNDKEPEQDRSKNCLIFERTGHNLPILVPTDCRMKKPFVCSRIVKKALPPTIVEGKSVIVDGSRYTLFTVNEIDEMSMEKNAGFRRLNGGGVKWIEARLECRKRGQYLATVLSNEAVKKIASVMLKSRPSIESVWLDAWSSDGTEWRWSTSGLILFPRHSSSSHYPPWLKGHPTAIANDEIDETNERQSRCLVLDRHLCPEHMSPVFIDLDCKKKRPFICQDGVVSSRRSSPDDVETLTSNSFSVNDRNFQFSTDSMTWNEGQDHCSKNNGKIASILDSKTLATILDRMADLYLDHVWVGGKTFETNDGWKWFDDSGKPLKNEGIGMPCSWCLGNDESVMLKSEPDSCLNLDREGHGLPLFYGLSCNVTRQHVLCGFDNVSRSADSYFRTSGNDRRLEDSKMRNFGSRSFLISGKSNDGTIKLNLTKSNHTFLNTDANGQKINAILRTTLGENDFSNRTNRFNLVKQGVTEFNSTKIFSINNQTKGGRKVGDLDENKKKLLAANGYNISGNDSVLGLELELADLRNNYTVKRINETQFF